MQTMQMGWKSSEEAIAAMTATERRWLIYRGSLTKRLRQTNANILHHIRQEKWETPQREESQHLALLTTEFARIRETDWCVQETLWVKTRAIIPAKTMQGKGQRLQVLGDLSLGDLLFADPDLQRSPFEFSRITIQEKNCWARRSIFFYFEKPLLVNEIFFPTIFNVNPSNDD